MKVFQKRRRIRPRNWLKNTTLLITKHHGQTMAQRSAVFRRIGVGF